MMRRKDRALPENEAAALLRGGQWGVLASADAEGVPLGTPLSYVVLDGAVYFHCALEGQKLRNIAAQPRVCFTVVGATQPAYTGGHFTAFYESAMAHGRAAVVADEDERRRALLALCEKYLPQHMDKAGEAITAAFAATCVVRIDLDRLSGKARRAQGGE